METARGYLGSVLRKRLGLRYLYRRVPEEEENNNLDDRRPPEVVQDEEQVPFWSRNRYFGSVLFNICTFILPAVYSTLSRLWVAKIDRSRLATTDSYTYISIFAEVINEGLPRGAYVIIGDKSNRSIASRVGISATLIITQAILGLILSIAFISSAAKFADTFVPEGIRDTSITYVRLSSFTTLFSAVSTSVAAATRALDRPDVPLGITSVTLIVNIILDLIFMSPVRVKRFRPTVNTQAVIRLVCEGCGSLAGVLYFIFSTKHLLKHTEYNSYETKPSVFALKRLARAGVFTFTESAIRNALYLWLISGIVSMGSDYATAWGVFNTIRWGLIMVPVMALEVSSLTFVGHNWGKWRRRVGAARRNHKASIRDIWLITRPAFMSCSIVAALEVLLYLILSFAGGVESFARYLSESDDVARITAYMWKTIDWCYIFYAISTQLASILLATQPRWYLYQSLASNLLYVLPWAIALTKITMDEDSAWKYHKWIFGGSLVVSFGLILLFDTVWAVRMKMGKNRMAPI